MTISKYTFKSLLRYATVSLIVVFLSLNIWRVLPTEGIMDLLLGLAPPVIFTTTAYFILLAAIDRDFRFLMKAAVSEVAKILRT
jgi:hypothetical protein